MSIKAPRNIPLYQRAVYKAIKREKSAKEADFLLSDLPVGRGFYWSFFDARKKSVNLFVVNSLRSS